MAKQEEPRLVTVKLEAAGGERDEYGNDIVEYVDIEIPIPADIDPAAVEKMIELEAQRDAVTARLAEIEKERAAAEKQRLATLERTLRQIARLFDGRAALDAQVEADVARASAATKKPAPYVQGRPVLPRRKGESLRDHTKREAKAQRSAAKPKPKPVDPLDRLKARVGL